MFKSIAETFYTYNMFSGYAFKLSCSQVETFFIIPYRWKVPFNLFSFQFTNYFYISASREAFDSNKLLSCQMDFLSGLSVHFY